MQKTYASLLHVFLSFVVAALPQLEAQDKASHIKTICSEAPGDQRGAAIGKPFKATWTETSVHRLENGKTYDSVVERSLARDSVGRERGETRYLSETEEGTTPTIITISDPLTHNLTVLSPKLRYMRVTHDAVPKIEDTPELVGKPWTKKPWSTPLCFAFDPSGEYLGGQYSVTQLGTKVILGVRAEGVLATRVLPAGYLGYETPITVTEERWYSDELRITLTNVVDDPRIGRGSLVITSLELSEPPARVFDQPLGYSTEIRVTGGLGSAPPPRR